MKEDIATILSYYTSNNTALYLYPGDIIIHKFGYELKELLNHNMRDDERYFILFDIYSGYAPYRNYSITKVIKYGRLYYCYIDKYSDYKIVIYRDVIYMINKEIGLYMRLHDNKITYIQSAEKFTSIANITLKRWYMTYSDVSIKYRDNSIELYELVDKKNDNRIYYYNDESDKIIIYIGNNIEDMRNKFNYYKNKNEGIHKYLLNGEYINLPL